MRTCTRKSLLCAVPFGAMFFATPLMAQNNPIPSAESAAFESGDFLVGIRVPLGGVAGASFGIGAAAEYALADTFGLNAAGYWSGYSQSVLGGEYSYSNILLTAGASYHYYRTAKLDLSGTFSLGYNIASVSLESDDENFAYEGDVGGFVWGAMANARYFFSDSFAAYLGLGYGLGYAQLGVDVSF